MGYLPREDLDAFAVEDLTRDELIDRYMRQRGLASPELRDALSLLADEDALRTTLRKPVEKKQRWMIHIYDAGPDPREDEPTDRDRDADAAAEELREMFERVGGRLYKRMPDVCSGGDVGLDFVAVVTIASGVATALGLTLKDVGARVLKILKRGNSTSGDVEALKAVAVFLLCERFPDVVPDDANIGSIGPAKADSERAIPIQAEYTYRIPDQRSGRVFLVEIDSEGELLGEIKVRSKSPKSN